MKTKQILVLYVALNGLFTAVDAALAQGTAFTYQGQMSANGSTANGSYDFTFALFNDASGISGQVGESQTNLDVGVTNGLFSVLLDFGTNFPGANRWLAIGVRTNGGASFTALNPLQELTPTPYAIYAPNAGFAASANSVAATGITGAIPLGQLPAAVVTNNQTGVTLTGTFAGDGANVTNVSAAALNGLNMTNFWQTGGNNAASGQFLGSTDNQPVEFRVNNGRSLRLEPGPADDGAPNVIGGSAVNFAAGGVAGATISGGGATNYPGIGESGNSVTADFGTVGGGNVNTAGGQYGTVGGGSQNNATGQYATVSGGGGNDAGNSWATVGGGDANFATSQFATVAGGGVNIAGGQYAAVGGGEGNYATGQYAAVGGGQENNAINSWVTVGGGFANYATGQFASVGGGGINIASGLYATVGGGQGNISTNSWATVGGGSANYATGQSGTVAGGQANNASGQYAAVGGGQGNNSTNSYATVPGGNGNVAGGQYSFAAGDLARAVNDGSFVWADAEGLPFASTTNNQFGVRANGGVRFLTGGAGMTLDGQPVLTNNALNVTLNGTFSGNGAGLTNLNITGMPLPPNVVTNTEIAVTLSGNFAGTFAGNGSALTGLSPANLTAGTASINITGNAATATSATTANLANNVVNGIAITNAVITNSVFAGDGGELTNLNITAAELPGGVVTNGEAGVTLSGAFNGTISGNGSGLTTLNPANLSAGTAGINITGNAATATSATSATTATTATLANNVAGGITISNALVTNSIFAGNGNGLTNLNIIAAELPGGVVTNGEVGVTLSGTFSGTIAGNGSGLTTLNPADLTAGTANINITGNAATATSATTATLASNVVNGITITNAVVTNSVFAGDGNGLTNLNIIAAELPGGVVTNGEAGVTLSGAFSGTISGNGSGLTTMNPANLAAGTASINITGNAATATSATTATTASLASNVASGITISNLLVTNSVFAGNGAGLTNLTITSGELPGTVVTDGESGVNLTGIFTGNGAGLTSVNAATVNGLGAANFWQTTGNSGTTAGVNFLGTTDNQPLELHVAAQRALRLEPGISGEGAPNVIGGSPFNFVTSGNVGGTIAGGGATDYAGTAFTNSVTADFGTVGGGYANHAGAAWATASGGASNTASGNFATVGGGIENSALAYSATVSGGFGNATFNSYATVGGGLNNNAVGEFGAVGGGQNNAAGNTNATVAGGQGNNATGGYTAMGGGYFNTALGNYATVAGGYSNAANGNFATVGGGQSNTNLPPNSTIGGGMNNTILSGGLDSTIGGGGGNNILANNSASAIAGGSGNTIGGSVDNGFIGGGFLNNAGGNFSTVSGGQGNRAGQIYDTVGGGNGNTASGGAATVGGGYGNIAGSPNATVPGGVSNVANGLYSFAAGRFAQALFQGTFVWADSQNTNFSSTTNDQFSARAQGGVVFTTGNGGSNQTVSWTPGNGSWSFSSDRDLKDRFAPVDQATVLDKVARLRVVEWSYKGYGQRHIGAMAQDFHALFPLNDNDKLLNDADLHGVELAAIQGLNQKLEAVTKEKDAEIEELKEKADKVDSLEKQLNELKQMVLLLAEKK